MKRVLSTAIVGSSMFGVAQAADLPARTMPMAPLPAVAPAFTGTGSFIEASTAAVPSPMGHPERVTAQRARGEHRG